MKQMSLAASGFELKTKREFLEEVELLVSWAELEALIAQHSPAGESGRPPFVGCTLLRSHLIQQCFELSDPAIEGALYDIELFRQFASAGERALEMQQAKKGNQWPFAMKAHICGDADSGLVHTVTGTAVNVNDVAQGHALLQGEEEVVFGDAGCQGADELPAVMGVAWQVAMRPGKRKAIKNTHWGELSERVQKFKASVRINVEPPSRVIRRRFGRVKVRYRGLKKNTQQLYTLFALSNLRMARRALLQEGKG